MNDKQKQEFLKLADATLDLQINTDYSVFINYYGHAGAFYVSIHKEKKGIVNKIYSKIIYLDEGDFDLEIEKTIDEIKALEEEGK